jgi:hypothetical protein
MAVPVGLMKLGMEILVIFQQEFSKIIKFLSDELVQKLDENLRNLYILPA